ncbi:MULTISPECIES: hypothetical protein [Haloferacaceae]|uniref:Uncharacterized protein n=2 Tax=Haloferacaceae TaxID=1644056 RepID=A0ABD6DBA2_9EURY|nr:MULTISPECIES: hypothetical protein [Halorubraceae]CDK38200.1 hypothetical protein BN903_400 [Halorubrum sp. AJ67]
MGTSNRSRPASGTADAQPEVPLRLDTFRTQDIDLTPQQGEEILLEIWRMTRNTRLIEIEYAHRGGVQADLQLSTHASEANQKRLKPATAAAKSFIKTVRKDHPLKLACGPCGEDRK